MNAPQISMLDLKPVFEAKNKDELILDVRTVEEYESGHVPGARNIPLDQVFKHAGELKQFRKVYVHCKMGGRAQRATADLESFGLGNLVCVSDGGMLDWIESGLPVE